MEWFFNKNFKSASQNKPFVRIGIKIDVTTMFGVQCDSELTTTRFSKFDYKDFHVNGVCEEALSFEEFTKNIGSFDFHTRERFKNCILDLSRAFRNHVTTASSKGVSISSGIQTEVYSDITSKRDIILNLIADEKFVEPISFEEETWEEIDSIGIEDESLMNEIIESVFANKDKEVSVRGKSYILKQKEGTDDIAIYVKTKKANKISEERETIPAKKIQTKKMAFCVDAKGLVNFNNNELYEIVNGGKEYILVKDIFGEERNMRSSRFRILDVEEELVED